VKPHRIRSSHIARFCSGVGSPVVEGATPADNAGGTIGSGCGGGMDTESLGSGGMVMESLSGGGMIIESLSGVGGAARIESLRGEMDRIALGNEGIDIGNGVGRRLVDGTWPEPPAAVLGLMSTKLVGRRSRLVLEFPGDPARSGTLEAILSRLI
jgi:hypothetical protein